MPGKKITVHKIFCSLKPLSQDRLPGFQVTGYKVLDSEENSEKIGFIISNVKILIFQQMKNSGVRTRVKWISKGFEIREEISPLDGMIVEPQKKNNILFVSREDNSMVVMQGEPVLKENAFIGQLIQVNWDINETVIVPLQRKAAFYCVLDSKNNRINVIVK
ncbi:MAG: hypothetical protein ACTSQ9_06185 [Candidatus Hodarchaeales archaeon]|jgi:hypothetical protein